jgi:hypothetical protein
MTASQTPSTPKPLSASVHAWQIPSQRWSQQTPSLHKTLTHEWSPSAQGVPRASLGRHWPLELQKLPAAQFEASKQELHTPFWQ